MLSLSPQVLMSLAKFNLKGKVGLDVTRIWRSNLPELLAMVEQALVR